MADKTSDFDSHWAHVSECITRMLAGETVTMAMYMHAYTAVHNLCSRQPRPDVAHRAGVAHREGSSARVNLSSRGLQTDYRNTAPLMGGDVYEKLIEHVEDYLQNLFLEAQKHSGEALLDFYVKAGKRYKTGARYIGHVFQFLNRHWIKRERDEGKRGTYDVCTLHMMLWHKALLPTSRPDISTQLKNALVEVIDKLRNGEAVGEYGQIREVIDFFQSFTLGEEYLATHPDAVYFYRNHVELPILQATQKFYEAKSKELMAENPHDVVEYMRSITACLDEEVGRGRMFFPDLTVSRVRKCCCTALVGEYFDLLLDEFQVSLNHSHIKDIARLSRLLSPMPGGLDCLTDKFRHHVGKEGLDAVDAGMETLGPQRYVGELVRIYYKYKGLIDEAFGDTKLGFLQALNNACRDFINAGSSGHGIDSKAPELLARYVDELLRKNIEERELDSSLKAVTSTLVYMENKDVFERHYSRLLAKRLLSHNHLLSTDGETTMINNLEEVCGFDYASRLRRMLGDMQLSKDLNLGFQGPGKTTGSFSVLSTSAWPVHPPETNFNPPVEVYASCDRFYRFYNIKHQGRKLTWLWQLCRGELRPTYCKRPHVFHVSLYQMAVLLLFNNNDYNSYEEIQAATQLEPRILDPILSILHNKAKVLLMSPDGNAIGPGTTFRVNYDVRFGKIKVNLNLQSTKDDKAEKEKINKAVKMDRDISMQATIVRIMKARKKLKYSQLLSETISQVSAHFKPEIANIKKCVETLLDREYLQRLEHDEIEYYSSEPEKTPDIPATDAAPAASAASPTTMADLPGLGLVESLATLGLD
ncbi:ubiquitin ligase (cullin) of SCF [Diatrype stigma]|uniref:Ubiquitin ligase (Cullin) of SCF n=1 Tax=Diatrype stigma TaxID=117547 RepID=A0AAN9UP90_9PEZI